MSHKCLSAAAPVAVLLISTARIFRPPRLSPICTSVTNLMVMGRSGLEVGLDFLHGVVMVECDQGRLPRRRGGERQHQRHASPETAEQAVVKT